MRRGAWRSAQAAFWNVASFAAYVGLLRVVITREWGDKMFTDETAQVVSELIKASLAPIFLLTAFGATLTVIDARLNRITDQVRALEQENGPDEEAFMRHKNEIASLLARAGDVGWAAAYCIISALLVAAVVVMMFIDLQVRMSLAHYVAATFTAAVVIYALSLVIYLRDVIRVNRQMTRNRAAIVSARKKDAATGSQ
jgi:Protein of unknown function (DUF2721)